MSASCGRAPSAQAADGMTMRDAVTFHALDAARLPGEAELARGIKSLAENVVALAKAPKGEDYSGPVLFEGMAGAQIMGEVLGHNLALTRRPVGDGGRGGGGAGQRTGRPDRRARAARILRRGGRSRRRRSAAAARCSANYEVDREGVLAKPLRADREGRAEELPADPPAGARLRRIERPRPAAGQLRRQHRHDQQPVRQLARDPAGRGVEEEADRAVPGPRASLTASSSAKWTSRRPLRSTKPAG